MAIVGNKLFTNGALNPQCLGAVPGANIRHTSVVDWCRALNAFVRSEVTGFRARPRWLGGNFKKRRGGEALMDYGLEGGLGGMSILCTKHFSPHPEIGAFLSAEGLHWLAAHSQAAAERPLVVQRGAVKLPVHTSSKLDQATAPRTTRLLDGAARGWNIEHGLAGTALPGLRGGAGDGADGTDGTDGHDMLGPPVAARGTRLSWGASRASRASPASDQSPPAAGPGMGTGEPADASLASPPAYSARPAPLAYVSSSSESEYQSSSSEDADYNSSLV